MPLFGARKTSIPAMLRSLGVLYSSGYAVDWSRIYPKHGDFVRIALLSMATTTLLDGERSALSAGACGQRPNWTFSVGPTFQIGRVWRRTTIGKSSWTSRSLPFLDDHRIEGVAALPASIFVEMASAAAHEAFGSRIDRDKRCRISSGAVYARRRSSDDAGDRCAGE